jgi:thiol:disulfide interchange protein DsbD
VTPLSRAAGGPARSSRTAILLCFLAALVYLELPWPPAGPSLEWRSDLEAALAEAAAEGRPAVLSFHAAWCSVCRKLDARSLRDPEVAAELERFVRVRIDASSSDAATADLLGRFDVQALPALRFVDPSGALLAEPRVVGFTPADDLSRVLRGIGAKVVPERGA